jgi:outer membrane protein assembly factor BamE (lipoprotein component of BamABCDE complex)
MKRMFFVLLFATTILGYAKDPNNVPSTKHDNTAKSEVIRAIKPKWAEPDTWRLRLKKDMSENAVKNYLGEPLYKAEGSDGATWYYQEIPEVYYEKGKSKIKCPRIGYISFYRKPNIIKQPSNNRSVLTGKYETSVYMGNTGRENLLVIGWVEPEFDKIVISDPNDTKKEPVRKPKKWEDEKNWNRVTVGLTDNSINKILGSPLRVTAGTDDDHWYYQDIPGCDSEPFGIITFKNKKVESWNCPFWPEVKKRLYEPVNP